MFRNKKVLSLILVILLIVSETVSAFADSGSFVAELNFDFETTENAAKTDLEYPLGNLIADAYIYEARKKGVEKVDLAIVDLGSIHGTFSAPGISSDDVRVITGYSPLATGTDLVVLMLKGSELKAIAEHDVSGKKKYEELDFSYSGLRFVYNTKRVKNDRIFKIGLYDEFGIDGEREFKKSETYIVICDLATAETIGLSGRAEILIGKDGKGLNGYEALSDYLVQLEEIPEYYKNAQQRKVRVVRGDPESILENCGPATWAVIIGIAFAVAVIIAVIKYLIPYIKKRGQN